MRSPWLHPSHAFCHGWRQHYEVSEGCVLLSTVCHNAGAQSNDICPEARSSQSHLSMTEPATTTSLISCCAFNSASFILRNLHNTDQQDEIFAFEGESRVQLVLKNFFQQLLYPWVTLMLTALFCSIGVMHHAWVLSELLPWWFCLCLRAVPFLLPAIVD